MRTKPKLPFSSARRIKILAISDPDWLRIESVCGSVPLMARNEINVAASAFLQAAEFERRAQPLDEVGARIQRIITATDRAFEAISLGTRGSDDVAVFIKRLITKHIGTKESGICSLMTDYLAACELAKKEVEDLRVGDQSFREGTAWGRWIRELTKIAKRYGMPTGVRKDSDRRAQPEGTMSSFVLLIWELQNSLPPQYRRHVQSKNALATAVSNARGVKTVA